MAEPINLNTCRLKRFLYMGDEGSRYVPLLIAKKQPFSIEKVNSINTLIGDKNGPNVIAEVLKVFKENNTICTDALIYTLALCATCKDINTKTSAYNAVPEICVESEQLFLFVAYIKQINSPHGGWGRGLRKAVSDWYHKQTEDQLAYQITKCVQSKGWTHKDLIHLAHVKPKTNALSAAIKYVMKGMDAFDEECKHLQIQSSTFANYVKTIHQIKHSTDEQVVARLIESCDKFDISQVPSHFLKSKEVWCSLIRRSTVSTILDQINRFKRLNFLKRNESVMNLLLEKLHQETLLDDDANLNPTGVFVALKKYEMVAKFSPLQNVSFGINRAAGRHKPNPKLLEALFSVFYASFKLLKAMGKRYLVAVDVRNQMTHNKVVGNVVLTPAIASALLLMSLVRSDNRMVTALAFGSKGLRTLDVNNKMTLNDITKRMKETAMGSVNLSEPMQWAQNKKKHIDVFIVCTDNHLFPTDLHPANVLKDYRKNMNLPNAKYIMCSLGVSTVTVAPHDEPGMLDIIGFDSNAVRIIRDFASDVF